tara:strand:+ start:1958 stop:2245 length:288 start_codon:yes stop_codon:yes gene_type:complete
MNKYEKNKPVKKYEQTTLDEAIDEVKDTADSVGVIPEELEAVLSVAQKRVKKDFKGLINQLESLDPMNSCPDCHAGTNALGKPLDCRTCNSSGRA